MKKMFKIVPCVLLTSLTLVSACACTGSVSDMRRRVRRLQEQTPQEEELDPNFFVDSESDEITQKSNAPDGNKCPDCPQEPDEEKLPPRNGPPRRGKRPNPKLLPCPLPMEEDAD